MDAGLLVYGSLFRSNCAGQTWDSDFCPVGGHLSGYLFWILALLPIFSAVPDLLLLLVDGRCFRQNASLYQLRLNL